MSFAQPSNVLIGLGANLPSLYGAPRATLAAALALIAAGPVRLMARSPWYESAPVPVSDQPWYVNAAIAGITLETADTVLKFLHEIEGKVGRVRGVANAARSLDLDLLAYDDLVAPASSDPARHGVAVLPHPRLQERAFVLRPLADIAPHWRHPVLHATPQEMLARLGNVTGLRLARGSDAVQ